MRIKKTEIESQYKTIESFNPEKDLLIIKNNQIKKIGFLGLLWSQMTGKNIATSNLTEIGVAIADFFQKNKYFLDLRKQNKISKKLNIIKEKIRSEQDAKSIDERIHQIREEVVPKLLKKNQNFAILQQEKEELAFQKNRGIQIDYDKWSQTLTPNEHSSEGLLLPFESKKGIFSKMHVEVGTAAFQGKRKSMEDADLALCAIFKNSQNESLPYALFGIFDGHGGTNASSFVKKELKSYLERSLRKQDLHGLSDGEIYQGLKECFQQLGKDYSGEDGTTAIVCLMIKEKIWLACVGDSRAILVNQRGEVIQGSEDAKPENPRYRKTIEKLGGFVGKDAQGIFRVFGEEKGCAVARTIGDKGIPGICSSPKITCFSTKNYEGGYLILACDGLTEGCTSKMIGDGAFNMGKKEMPPHQIAINLAAQSIKNGSLDNVSVIVVKIPIKPIKS